MDVNTYQNQSGQSILEFLFMLPTLLAFTAILLRVNTAIQISIVDQQYARAQTFLLAGHSAFYPEIAKQSRLISNTTNQLIVGVSDNQATGDNYTPKATTQWIGSGRNNESAGAGHEEPHLRGNVRIRNSVTLCTPNLFVNNSGQPVPASEMTEGSNMPPYCGSSFNYE